MISRSTIPTSQLPHIDRQAIETLLEGMFTFEPAVLEEDIDFHRMRAVVRLKRRLVTGEVTGGFTQEREHQPIYECPVLHFKNRFGLNRVRYKKGDDVTVVFSARAKDMLVREAHKTNIDPQYKRALHEQDAFVLLGFLCDTGEPKAPLDKKDEMGINSIEMGQDDWVHYWGRFGTEGWGARIYTTPQGDHIIHPRMGRHVWLEEKARWKILFAEPCANKYNNHGNLGMPGPGDPPTLASFWWFPTSEWSEFHHVDNPINF
jgi:hypothetical protein